MMPNPVTQDMTVSTISVGMQAEQAAANYLEQLGFKLLERNYRKPYCEIDIVAVLDEVIYFVEVKYRATDNFGSGLEYVHAQKLLHMQRAAAIWVAHRRWEGEYTLSAVAVGGLDYQVLDFIESIE